MNGITIFWILVVITGLGFRLGWRLADSSFELVFPYVVELLKRFKKEAKKDV